MAEEEDDHFTRLALSFLGHESMNETAAYVSRGRAHESLPTDQVEDRWIEALRHLVEDGSRTQEMDDFAAELRLRGLDPPYDRVGPEIEVLQQKLQQKIAEVGGLPPDGSLGDKIDAYLRARDEPSS